MNAEVVVLGGTFDPVHNGHLDILEQVLDRSGARRGVLLPAATPNLREPARAPGAVRLAMCTAAVADHPRLEVSDLELRRGGVSYMVDTLPALRAEFGENTALLLGADAARAIRRWHAAPELLAAGTFIVINRSGEHGITHAELHELGYPVERTALFEVRSPQLHAADVRRRVASGESIDSLVHPAVAAIIEAEQLYRERATRA